VFRQAAKLRPDAPMQTVLGHALFRQEKFEEAEAAYREAVRLRPQDATAFYWLGQTCYRQRKFAEAAAAFGEAARLQPGQWEYHAQLGGALFMLAKFAEAETAFRAALRLNSQNADAQYWLAQSLLKQEKLEAAAAAFKMAGKLTAAQKGERPGATQIVPGESPTATVNATVNSTVEPPPSIVPAPPPAPKPLLGAADLSNPATVARLAQRFNELGNVLFDQNKFTQCAQAFEMATRLVPDDARYWANWAGSLLRGGQRGKALEKAKKAQRLGLQDSHWALKALGLQK
jgi:cytochrome c-type biogenesis protein CcmH/NrfG